MSSSPRVWALLAAVSLLATGCVNFLRYPYLTDANTSSGAASVIVNFATSSSSPPPVVSYGLPGDQCTGSSATASGVPIVVGTVTEYQYRATLTGLLPATSYCYRIAQEGTDLMGRDPSPTFVTPPPTDSSAPFSFAVLGDWGAGSPDEAAVLGRIGASPANFVVSLGDTAYPNGSQADYGDLNGGKVFAAQYWKQVGATRPGYMAVGHHDFVDATPLLVNWPQDHAVQSSGGRYQIDTYCCTSALPQPTQQPSAWYAFDWGNARFYVLEAAWGDNAGGYAADFDAHWNQPVPGCAPCGTELQWLNSDLAAHASTQVKFAFFFYPPYNDDPDQGSDTYLAGPQHLEGLLADNGVDVIFSGHAHQYQRNVPQIPGSPTLTYVSGGGGSILGSITCSLFDAFGLGDNSSCHAPLPTPEQVHHFILVQVSGNQVTVTPTDETGNTFDVQTFTVPTPAPPPPPPSNAWSKWLTTVNLQGGLRSGPAVASPAPNQLDIFATSPSGRLQHLCWTGSAWCTWEDLAQPAVGPLVGDPAAVSPGPNRIDVFARGSDNQLWHRASVAGQWALWEPLGGVLSSEPAVASWTANRLDVFVRGTDNQLWHKWWDNNAWSPWEPLGGVLTSDPSAVSWGPNRIDVFVRGTDNQLWHKWWDGSAWQAYEPLGGVLNGKAGISSWAANRLDIFVRGTDNQLWHKWWNGSAWQAYEPLGGVLTSDPGAVSWAPNRIAVFALSADDQLQADYW